MISIGENLTRTTNYEKMEVLILIKQMKRIGEVITLEVENIKFLISVKERGWSEELRSNISNMEKRQEKDVESVSKSESVIGLELKNLWWANETFRRRKL